MDGIDAADAAAVSDTDEEELKHLAIQMLQTCDMMEEGDLLT